MLKKNMDRFLTKESLRRKPSAIRALQPLVQMDGMLSLGGGVPNPQTFPIKGLSMTLQDGRRLEINETDTREALQYSTTAGIPRLVTFLRQLQLQQHQSKQELIVTTGSQDALSKAFDMLIENGDTFVVEQPTYSGSLACLHAKDCNMLAVETDSEGLVPASLQDILSKNSGVKFLYTIPNGSNPTGASTSEQRRHEIYQLCHKHDILILEDDPYYYLNYSEKKPASYLSMDVDQRVLRFDSLSKCVSSGLRLGFVTGSAQLVERIMLHEQCSNLHTSGVSQMLMLQLVQQLWMNDTDKFLQHCHQVAQFYKQRCLLAVKYIKQYLPESIKFTQPESGMFLWLDTGKDTAGITHQLMIEHKVICLAGIDFIPNRRVPSTHVRISFSTGSEQDLEEGIRRLGRLLKQFT